jgi:hypothetical protein
MVMADVADPLGMAQQHPEKERQRLRTSHALRIDGETQRKFIGLFGLALPAALVIAVTIRPTNGLSTWLDSLSSYYYTSGIAVLEGLLVALALFLVAYQGYPGKYQWADKWASGLAGGLRWSSHSFRPTRRSRTCNRRGGRRKPAKFTTWRRL